MRPERFSPLPPETAAQLYAAVQRAEPDHASALAYYPDDHRAAALTLMAFVSEVREVPARVSEPMLGEIRLQWWRDALDEVFGTRPVRAHPLVEGLASTVRHRRQLEQPMRKIIDESAHFLEPFLVRSIDDVLALTQVHDGGLAHLLAAALEAPNETLTALGAIYGALRAMVAAQRQDQHPLMAAGRISQMPHADETREALGKRFNTGWRALVPIPQGIVPVALGLKSGRILASGKAPTRLGRAFMQFTTTLRGE